MFKKKEQDKDKAKMKKELDKHAAQVQAEWERKQQLSKRVLNKEYVRSQLAIQAEEDEKIKAKQDAMISKTMKQIKKTELSAFKCILCGSWVDMQNLTCPKCGQLFCQWCGASMDMLNPGICPRCQRPPMYTPAELVITTVESMAPEDRFWESLPTCPKCGGTVQPDWTECPICNAKLTPSAAGAPPAESESFEEAPPEDIPEEQNPEAMAPGDEPKRKEEKKGKKSGI